MQKITGTQKKIIIAASVIAAALLFVWLFVYMPTANKVASIKMELAGINEQITHIESMAEEGKSIGEAIEELQEEFKRMEDRFPEKEEEALQAVSGFARRLGMEVISIKPQPKRSFRDEDDKAVEFEDRICQRVFVTVQMKGSYKQLVEYIDMLRRSLPAFVCIESLNVGRDESIKTETPRLEVQLGFNLYLLS